MGQIQGAGRVSFPLPMTLQPQRRSQAPRTGCSGCGALAKRIQEILNEKTRRTRRQASICQLILKHADLLLCVVDNSLQARRIVGQIVSRLKSALP